jgi:hypothetical protein
MNKYLLLILSVFVNTLISAQTNETETFDYYLELITELSSKNESESDFNDLSIELYDLWESPLNINTAENYELGRLFWLTEVQLNNLIAYVEKQKPVLSLYELAFVPGFDTSLVLTLKPFIVFENVHKESLRKSPRNWLLYRAGRTLETQKGYSDNKFEGNAWKQNAKYKFQSGDKISAGFTLEKDAGETMFKGSNRAGPDYYSAYLKVNNLGFLKSVCIGDYTAGFGQGLVAGPGFALGKSSQAVNLVQKDVGIRPYTSNDENRYLRGIASSISIKPIELTVFLSYKKIDANITLVDSSGNAKEVSALQTTGYHATDNEIADENSLQEFTAGTRVAFRSARFHTGISLIHTKYNADIEPQPTSYNRYYFRGNNNTNIGIDYKLNYSNTVFFGEAAIDQQGNPALINGISTYIGERLQFNILHRYYSRAYNSFYGNAFGENSRIQNEEGVYAGFRLPLVKNITLACYADFFRFPWLRFEVDAPSHGKEFLAQAEYRPRSSFFAYFQYRYKLKQENFADSFDVTNAIVDSKSNRFRLHASYTPNDALSLSTRLEFGFYNTGEMAKEKSFLLYQDIKYSFEKLPLQLYLRYAVFDTDSYNSQIYSYENDVLYAFSMGSYYLQGQRYYAMIKYSPSRAVDFWIKYSQSVYPAEESIGSDMYQINGNSRSDIRMQVIVKF